MIFVENKAQKIDVSQFAILLYGEPKTGKTTFCSTFPEPLIIDTERGTKNIKLGHHVSITKWNDILQLPIEIGTQFKTLVFDSIDNVYKMCWQAVIKKAGVDDPSDMAWGKGWRKVDKAFFDFLMLILALNRGIIFVSHETRITETNRFIKPTLNDRALSLIAAISDVICRAYVVEVKGEYHNMLRVKGGEDLMLGSRFNPKNDVISIPDVNSGYAKFEALFKEENHGKAK